MYFVYGLYNAERNKIYVGYTFDLEKRLARHNGLLKNKKSSFTSKQSGTWRVIYKEKVLTRQLAMKRERELKSCQGRKFIKSFIENSGA